MVPRPTKTPHRPRALGNRYADAAVEGGELVVVGVRFDEDDPDAGESVVVRLRPGRSEAVGRADGIARALVFVQGVAHVLLEGGRFARADDDRGVTVRDGVLDVVAHGDGVLLLGDDGVVRRASFDASTGTAVLTERGAAVTGPRRLASDHQRVVVLTGQSVVDDVGRTLLARGGAAVAVAGDVLAVIDGKELVVARGDTVRVFSVAHELHSVAVFGDRIFVGSRAAGLFVLADSDDRVRPLRPSLRARALRVDAGRLVVAADLLVATSDDGDEFATRDLAGFIRLAEKAS